MPIQIIGKERIQARENAADRALKREEMLGEMEYKKAYIKTQEQQLKIQARNADTESEKLRYSKKADAMAMAAKAMDIAKDQKDPMRFMQGWANTYKDVSRELGDPDFASGWESFNTSGQAKKSYGEAEQSSAMAELIRNRMGTGNSAANAVGGGGMRGMEDNSPLIPETTVDGTKIIFPDDTAREAIIKKRATDMETAQQAAAGIASGIGGIEESGARLPKGEGLFGTIANTANLAYNKATKGKLAPDINTVESFGASMVQDMAKLKQGGARLSDQDIAMMLSFIPYYGGRNKDGSLKLISESNATYARKLQVLKAFKNAMTVGDPVAAGDAVKQVLGSVGGISTRKSLTTGAKSKFKVEVE